MLDLVSNLFMKYNLKVISKIMLDFFEVAFVGAAIFLLLYFFFGQFLQVIGDSMVPTFKDQEQLVAEKFSIKFSPLKRGEIAIFEHPQIADRYLIKRVVGLPGEELKIADGDIYINAEFLEESYLSNEVVTKGGPVITEGDHFIIPDDMYVMLGDNRPESSDSRDFGPIRIENIIGRVFFVYYPIQNFRFVELPDLGDLDLGKLEMPELLKRLPAELPLLSF